MPGPRCGPSPALRAASVHCSMQVPLRCTIRGRGRGEGGGGGRSDRLRLLASCCRNLQCAPKDCVGVVVRRLHSCQEGSGVWRVGWQGCGIVEFESASDAERAIKELHDSQAGPSAPPLLRTTASTQAVTAFLRHAAGA